MVQHIICRTLRGRSLLTPDRAGDFKLIINGVIAKALENTPEIQLYNYAFLPNHVHFMLFAENRDQVAEFMRFVQSEISKQIGRRIGWRGPFWATSGYLSTALPTEESRDKCFEYILAQGTKEGLVGRPIDWTGAHGAEFWIKQQGKGCVEGTWFNGTDYSKRKYRWLLTINGKKPDKKDYTTTKSFSFVPLPHWKRRNESPQYIVAKMNVNIISAAKKKREQTGLPIMGMEKIYKSNREKIRDAFELPWHKRKSVIVAWCSARNDTVRDYLERYWAFQKDFLYAVHGLGEFPVGAWVPGQTRVVTG